MKPSRLVIQLLAGFLSGAIILGALSGLGLELPRLEQLFWAMLLVLLCSSAVDAYLLTRLPSPTLQRNLNQRLPQGRWCEVRLRLTHSFTQPLHVELFDYLPAEMDYENLPLTLELRPGQFSEGAYRIRANQRGLFTWPNCEILLPSPMRLWHARRLLTCTDSTRVYPNFTQLYQQDLMAEHDWLNNLGIKQQPRRGSGLEFHQLREFREGDSLRQIDWKATARKRSPIAREYQDERDQQVIFLLDCSRRMRSQDDALSHFDHALNSLLLLSHVALRQGDAVGLATFAAQHNQFIAPAKGAAQLKLLLNRLYDLHTTTQPADYEVAIDQLMARQKRRALVILLTNLRDEDAQSLPTALQRLSRKHRVLVANLREQVLDELRQTPVQSYAQAVDYCGAVDYINARSQLNEQLQGMKIALLESTPEQLTPTLINRYVAWKKAATL